MAALERLAPNWLSEDEIPPVVWPIASRSPNTPGVQGQPFKLDYQRDMLCSINRHVENGMRYLPAGIISVTYAGDGLHISV